MFKISPCTHVYTAASAQGGKGTSICIPGWQNSFQGRMLSRLSRVVGEGNDYVIEITGWDCKSGRPLSGVSTSCGGKVKRDEIPGSSLSEGPRFSFPSVAALLAETFR